MKDLDNKTTTTIKYKENKLLKLITNEDKFNIHKIAGVICLLNFTRTSHSDVRLLG